MCAGTSTHTHTHTHKSIETGGMVKAILNSERCDRQGIDFNGLLQYLIVM